MRIIHYTVQAVHVDKGISVETTTEYFGPPIPFRAPTICMEPFQNEAHFSWLHSLPYFEWSQKWNSFNNWRTFFLLIIHLLHRHANVSIRPYSDNRWFFDWSPNGPKHTPGAFLWADENCPFSTYLKTEAVYQSHIKFDPCVHAIKIGKHLIVKAGAEGRLSPIQLIFRQMHSKLVPKWFFVGMLLVARREGLLPKTMIPWPSWGH